MVHLSERDVIDPTKEEGERVVGTADARMAEFGVRLRFGITGDRTFHGINPFVVAGLGVGLDVAGSAPADALVEPGDEFVYGTSFVPTFGAGLRIFPSDRIEARLEVGTQLWVFDTPPTFKLSGRFGPDIGDSQTIDFNFISFALGIRF
jgi:hypothetical protein